MNIGEFLGVHQPVRPAGRPLRCSAMFVLGFIQGTIRRLLGLASMLFSFLFAANLRDPLGDYLAQNWNAVPATSTRSCSGSGSSSSPRRSPSPSSSRASTTSAAVPEGHVRRRDHRRPPRHASRRLFLVGCVHHHPRLVLPDPDDPDDRTTSSAGSARSSTTDEHARRRGPLPDAPDPGLHPRSSGCCSRPTSRRSTSRSG